MQKDNSYKSYADLLNSLVESAKQEIREAIEIATEEAFHRYSVYGQSSGK